MIEDRPAMQTILGASGQIGRELAAHLKRDFSTDIRLVSRRPQKVNDSDTLHRADLLDLEQTMRAVTGSDVVYLTAGLPMDTHLWVTQWPILMRNAIRACEEHGAKLVFFDNAYMCPQTEQPQTESMPFAPNGRKGRVRAEIAKELLGSIEEGCLQAMICRAPEFYGPGRTQSITNSTIIDNLASGRAAKVFLRDDTLRSLIYTPDASRAMALLGNTPDAYNQTWHLPCDDARLTYQQFIAVAAEIFGVRAQYEVLSRWQLALAGLIDRAAREATELLPRYRADNIFISDKFKTRFPSFRITTFREGLTAIRNERHRSHGVGDRSG